MGVSVVVPYFEAPSELDRTLAAFERQTYPLDLFEVIVVDDGSRQPLHRPRDTPLDISVVYQENRGFGLARARNNGAHAAKYDILVFLDGDMMAEAELVAAHARWHHVLSDAITLGIYSRVSASGLNAQALRDRPGSIAVLLGDRSFRPPWAEGLLSRTDDLTSTSDGLFHAASGGNLGVSRRFYESIGGYDASFNQYGLEDTEFAYRAYTQGALLVPARDAFAWHQGEWDDGREAKEHDVRARHAKVSNLIAHPSFRRVSPGRIFAVPRFVVTIPVENEPVEQIAQATENILAGTEFDLVVRIGMSAAKRAEDIAWLQDRYGFDARVRVAPTSTALDGFPATPFHVTMPPVAGPRGLIHRLFMKMGDSVTASGNLRDGSPVSITRAWALHRARRTGKVVAAFGNAVEIKVDRTSDFVRFFRAVATQRAVWRRPGLRAGMELILQRAGRIRGPRTAWVFCRWLLGVIGARPQRQANARSKLPTSSGPTRAPISIGVEIVALGDRAQAVFGFCAHVRHEVDDRHVDVVLLDSDQEIEGVNAPKVILSENPRIAIPALDPRVHNPIGWLRDVENRILALGPRHLVPTGVETHATVSLRDENALRHCHHVVDVAEFHKDTLERAGALVRLAATGTPIYVADRQPELEALLGAELHSAITTDMRHARSYERELLSIRLRRIALRDHSLKSRARQICDQVMPDPPTVPSVSILLATNRPDFLPWAISNVIRQNYPRLELVLALHGAGFDDVHVHRTLERLSTGVRIVTMEAPPYSWCCAERGRGRGERLARHEDGRRRSIRCGPHLGSRPGTWLLRRPTRGQGHRVRLP